MKKNFLYLGLILIAAGVLIGFIMPGISVGSLFPTPVPQSLAVNASSIESLPIQLNDTGIAVLTFNASAPLDFYLANSSAYAAISGANASSRATALGLEGDGVYEVYENSTTGAFPYVGYPNVSSPSYLLNITFMPPGTYYAIFSNPAASQVQVGVLLTPVSATNIQSGESSLLTYFGAAALLVLVGLGIVAYALLAKGKASSPQTEIDAEAAREYEKLDRQGKKKGK